MKSAVALSVIALAAALSLSVFGQTLDPPSYSTATTGIGTTSKNSSGAAPSSTANPESNTDEHDDTLYRGKTSDMETTLLRDEGALHFKTHPKEKIQSVESLKSLQTSRTDPTFQGSLVNSGVSSIDKLAQKSAPAKGVVLPAEDKGDPRFVRRHLTFTPQSDEKTAKPEADSSPSPTPSPTTSPPAKTSGDSKQ